MSINISRRNLIGTTAAGVAAVTAASRPAVIAQDDKPTISVGSKNFTEHLILGEIVSQLLENAGYGVDRQLNLGGTMVAFEALLNGEIDTYVEYTGTALIAVLGQELPEREKGMEEEDVATPGAYGGYSDSIFDIVADQYPKEFGVEWLERWGFNNTYALALRRDRAEELGVTKVSDLEPMAGDMSIGTDAEASIREDGVPGLQKAYGFDFDRIVTLDAGLMYSAVADGEVDVITAFTTDGRIDSMDLKLLEDDLEFFPPYHPAPIVRQDTLEENPDLREILNQLAGKIDDARMVEMNHLSDGEGMEHAEIVRNLLIEEGIVDED